MCHKSLPFVAVLVAATGCAPSIEAPSPTPGVETPTPVPGDVATLDTQAGTTLSQVNATDAAAWIYLDLDTGAQVHPEDAASDPAWDLAFQRYLIALNGGASGGGSVEAAVLPGADFGALAEAPAEGWATDQPDGGDENAEPDRVFDGWYAYDPSTHVLTPADLVYVVATSDGALIKLQMAGYYDAHGTSGYPSFWWGPVDAP